MHKAMIYVRGLVMKFSNATKEEIIKTDILGHVKSQLTRISKLGSKVENLKTSFPKKCTKCGRVFIDIKAFNQETDKLPRGRDEVCYVINREVKIYKFRNCPSPCHSTLVAVCDERRDTTFEGRMRRQIFDEIFEILFDNMKIEAAELHSLVLYLTRAVAFEGLSPDESIALLKEDIKTNRFEGFIDESLMYEKIDTLLG